MKSTFENSTTILGDMQADADHDGISAWAEEAYDLVDGESADTDADGLLDGEEWFIFGTMPKVADSDDDGLGDGDEVAPQRIDLDGRETFLCRALDSAQYALQIRIDSAHGRKAIGVDGVEAHCDTL